MAVVTVVKARPVLVPGYEVNDKYMPAVDVVAGDLLVYTGVITNGLPVMTVAPTTGITEADGIALQNAYTGEEAASCGIQGEMDGFSGLTPGAPIYPSVATAGKMNTTAISGATIRIKAVRASRIRYSFV